MSTDTSNKTVVSDDILGYCGAHFCSNVNLTNITGNDESGSIIEKPPLDLIQLLTGICMGFALLAAVIVALLVDNTTYGSIVSILYYVYTDLCDDESMIQNLSIQKIIGLKKRSQKTRNQTGNFSSQHLNI